MLTKSNTIKSNISSGANTNNTDTASIKKVSYYQKNSMVNGIMQPILEAELITVKRDSKIGSSKIMTEKQRNSLSDKNTFQKGRNSVKYCDDQQNEIVVKPILKKPKRSRNLKSLKLPEKSKSLKFADELEGNVTNRKQNPLEEVVIVESYKKYYIDSDDETKIKNGKTKAVCHCNCSIF